MKMQLLAFVHDLAVLYVGLPGQWIFVAYCIFLRQRQRRANADGPATDQWDAMLTSSSLHLVTFDLSDLSALAVRWLQVLQEAVPRLLRGWGEAAISSAMPRPVFDYDPWVASSAAKAARDLEA